MEAVLRPIVKRAPFEIEKPLSAMDRLESVIETELLVVDPKSSTRSTGVGDETPLHSTEPPATMTFPSLMLHRAEVMKETLDAQLAGEKTGGSHSRVFHWHTSR
jgi:hypothetical protein